MNRVLNHLSPATVIASIALFVALGGVSYGLATGTIDSREIRDNTIRSKDIRNNGVYTRDIRNNDIRAIDIRNGTIRGRDVAKGTLTGDNINMAKLDQVPDAAALGGVPAGGYVRASEPVHLIGAGGEPQFEEGAAALGGAYLPPGFWRDGAGTVRLQGVADLSGPGEAVVTLPPGYRPSATVVLLAATTSAAELARIEIAPSGVLTATSLGAPALEDVSLDGLAFRTPG